MKIRNGFVSNSSSSSFIIRAEGEFSTVKDVAKYIIDNVEYYEYIEELKTLESLSDFDTPVHFNTGGDHTYIRKVDDKILMTTTQNINFKKLEELCLTKEDLTKKFCKKFSHTSEYGEKIRLDDPREFFYFYPKFDDFNILEHNTLGRHKYIRDCPYCKKGYTIGWVLKGGKEICECQINQLKRKQKLEKINTI